MKSTIQSIIFLLALSVMLSACTNPPSGNTYSTTEAGKMQDVQFGTVVSVRDVMIEQNSTDTGQVTGAMIGGVAGSEVGKGKGKVVGSIAGAVAGGAIGSIIDRNAQAKPGVEVIIELDSGRTVALVQLADQEFVEGDEVKIITRDGKSRVTH